MTYVTSHEYFKSGCTVCQCLLPLAKRTYMFYVLEEAACYQLTVQSLPLLHLAHSADPDYPPHTSSLPLQRCHVSA